MKRRKFIKSWLQAAGAFYVSGVPGCRSRAGQKNTGQHADEPRVVLAKNDAVRDKNDQLISDNIGKLLDSAMENLLQVSKAETGWKQLFKPEDVVGIKVNCLAGRGISTHYELVEAIIESLKTAGVPEKNIIIWDRANRDLERAGYKIQTNRNKLKCYGNDQVGYSRELYEFGEVGSSLSNILVHQCTAVINVPILKDHGICGMTNALKNYFGAIHNPNKYHDNLGEPFIADVNMLSPIRAKNRLIVSDLLTAQYEGGPPYMPQWAWHENGVMLGFDPVAMDTVGWDIIEKKRKESGKPSLKEAGREPTYIATAADEDHRLGVNDLEKIKLIQV